MVDLLLARSMLLKSAYEWIEEGVSYEELHRGIEKRADYFKVRNCLNHQSVTHIINGRFVRQECD